MERNNGDNDTYEHSDLIDQSQEIPEYMKNFALIIEDEEIAQLQISKELKKIEFGYRICPTVTKARDECLKLIEEGIQVNVIFLDLYLEDNSTGLDFLRMMRNNSWFPNAYVLVLSGSEDIDIMKDFSKLEADSYKIKPITKDVFASVKESFLEKIAKNEEICPFPNYFFEKEIGSGTQGKVYLVGKRGTNKRFAMKVVEPPRDKPFIKEPDEVFYLKYLNAPTIISLEESQIKNNKLYMFMEYAEYGTLNQRINEKIKSKEKFTYDEILDWMTQLYIGLYVIHSKGIIHRDIKSANLFLNQDNVIKIGDLGTARQADKATTIVGTPNYMAPEMEELQKYTYKIDVFSAGIVLYELIYLKNPSQTLAKENKSDKKTETLLGLINNDKNIDKNLKRLLILTLSREEKRASAKDLLSLNFIHKRAEKLFKGVLKDPYHADELLEIPIVPDDYIFDFERKNFNNITDFFLLYKFTQKTMLVNSTLMYRNYYSFEKEEFAEKAYLENSKKEMKLRNEDWNALIDNKFIQFAFKYKGREYYKLQLNEKEDVDNSIRTPINQEKIFQMQGRPVGFTSDLLGKAVDIVNNICKYYGNKWHQIKALLLEETVYSFFVEIKQLQEFKLSNITDKPQLFASLLNIYQIMYYHYIFKILVGKVVNYEKYSFSKLFYLFLTNNLKKVDVVYEIEGKKISIFDLKEILINGNYNGNFIGNIWTNFKNEDFSKHFLYDEISIRTKSELELKLRTLCLDPPNNFKTGSLLYVPAVTQFESKNIAKDIDKHFETFIKEKILLVPDSLRIPFLFKKYLKDFSMKEKEMQIYILNNLFVGDDNNEKIKMVMTLVLQDIIRVKYYDLNED